VREREKLNNVINYNVAFQIDPQATFFMPHVSVCEEGNLSRIDKKEDGRSCTFRERVYHVCV
jgi:hypothetical protein